MDIAALDGYIVDYLADNQAVPAVTRVEDRSPDGVARRGLTGADGDVVADGRVRERDPAGPTPTPEQRRTHLVIGVTTFAGGVIIVQQSLPVSLAQPV